LEGHTASPNAHNSHAASAPLNLPVGAERKREMSSAFGETNNSNVHCEDVNEQLQRRQTDGQKCTWHLGTTEPNPHFSHPRVPRPNILPDILVRDANG
jgi:hypothetical protein